MPAGGGHIAIVGGGTAGWLAALVMHRAAARSGKPAPKVSVIESPDIPTVGVGEGSTALFRQVMQELGIDEAEFLRETGAALKFGIKHAGWRKDRRDYYGPIDDPNALSPAPTGAPRNWLHQARLRAGKDIAGAHLFTYLMKGGKSGVALGKDGTQTPLSPYHHAYHFDQARLGRFLASKAVGVDHLRVEVAGITRDTETGNITHLTCKDADDVPVDFVIDCTGFRRAILGQLGADWHSYADMLPLNKAMPFWLDHDGGDIAPYTLARAMNAGWMWGIPVQDRMGCGYVFSDAHISPEAAQAEVEAHLGHKITPRGVIDIAPGRVKTAWSHNCVALGLAQSFLEPLEATSIHGTLVQLLLLTSTDPADLVAGTWGKARDNYNQTAAGQVDDFAQFINIHYAGGRNDTPFWADMTAQGITAANRDRLAHWAAKPLLPSDFAAFPGNLPHVEEPLYAPVLDGLGLLPSGPAKAALGDDPALRMAARKTTERLTAEFKSAARRAVPHHAFLTSAAPAMEQA